MKKSTRILAFLMAFAMLIGSFSVMGSAYEAYKGAAIKNSYNDIDTPVFTTEQAATMALDEVDRMLAKEQIYLNIYVGELDLRSVNYAITSIDNLLTKASSLLGLLGSAADLTIASLKDSDDGQPMQRGSATTTGNVTDVKFITNLLDFLGDNAGIFEQYANGTITLGILNGIIADFVFNVRELVIGLGYSLTEAGKDYDPMDGDFATEVPEEFRGSTDGAINLVQSILNEFVLGEWVMLDEYFQYPWKTANTRYDYYSFADDYNETAPDWENYDYYGYKHPNEWVLVGLGGCVRVPAGDPAPAPVYDAVKITGNLDGYTFIENLLRRAFDYLLVPVLNNQTRHALREWCGIEYKEEYTNRTVWNPTTMTWDENESYDPLYAGETVYPTEENATIYNDVFNCNAYMAKVGDTIPEGKTLISQINDILGRFLIGETREDGTSTGLLHLTDAEGIATYVPYESFTTGTVGDWTWQFGSNSYLFTNIANVAKYVLQITGRLLFADYVEVPSVDVIEEYNDQQVVAFILRSIFNGSVDWMYIPNDAENQTILGVAYSAVEQLAYQDIPQFTYERPSVADYASDMQTYYDLLIDQALNILLDVAVYNLNESFDANPAAGAKAGEGLIPYTEDIGSWGDIAVMVATWAVNEYGPLLAIYKDLHTGGKNTANLTMDHVWTDLDTILNSIIPIVGSSAWINSEISTKAFSNGDSAVVKNLLFEYILKPVYTLDATNFSKIFDKNTTGSFATMNGVAIIADILDNVFDLLFPNVFKNNATSIDEILQNNLLGTMVYDLIRTLGTESFTGKTNAVTINGRANDIVKVALPVVDMILGLSGEQEFEEMEIYMPEVFEVGTSTTFGVYNGSSGINTGYTDASGTFTQDTLYEYSVVSVLAQAHHADGSDSSNLSYSGISNTTKFSGGDSVNVTIAPDGIVDGDIIEFTVNYKVSGEEEGTTIGGQLTKTVYAYAGANAEGDDVREQEVELSDGIKILYSTDIYLNQGDDLDDIEGFSIRIQDNDKNKDWPGEDTDGDGEIDNTVHATENVVKLGDVGNSNAVFAATGTEVTIANLSGQDGIYMLNPFKLATKADGSFYERYEDFYELDTEGNVVIDETTQKPVVTGNNAGITDGDYSVTVPVTLYDATGTTVVATQNVTVRIHLYDDFGLPGAFDSAVSKNRQTSEYNNTATGFDIAWSNYIAAVKNAAKLALTPKSGDNFMTFIGMNDTEDDYVNYYEQRALELEAAIAAIEEFKASAGVTGIKNIIKAHDGYNYEDITFQDTVDGVTYTFHYQDPIEYYEDGYVFFGERNYIPYLYDRYRDARGRGQDLVDSQEIFVKAPASAVGIYGEGYVFSAEEEGEYYDSLRAAVERMKNPEIVGSTEAAYAEHMLDLTSRRLVALEASKDKLQAMYDLYSDIDLTTGESKYTSESFEAYRNAIEKAEKVLAKPTKDALGAITDECTNPVEVNISMSKLVEARKKLVESCDFSALGDKIEEVALYIDLEADYTPESFAVFKAAYDEAVDLYNQKDSMGKTDANQDKIDNAVIALDDAYNALESAAAAEPTWEFDTDLSSMTDTIKKKFIDNDEQLVPTLRSSTTHKTPSAAKVDTIIAPDGVTVVDDVIVCVGVNPTMAGIKAIIDPDSLNNCYVTAKASGSNSYMQGKGFSTGALLQIKSSEDDSVIKTYMLIYYGNVNGDLKFNSLDTTAAKRINTLKHTPKTNPECYAAYIAMNVDGDIKISAQDYGYIKNAVKGSVKINQVTNKVTR